MNVLFICKSNAERSQMAEILFNYHPKKNKKHKAVSAGLKVEEENSIGRPAGLVVTELLLSMGYNAISKAKRQQLTLDLAKRADKIIIILNKKELKKFQLPTYVKNSPKTIYWDGDFYKAPKHIFNTFPPKTYAYHLRVLEKIINKVDDLVEETR
jgi:protein-tyrosine-phosphatase